MKNIFLSLFLISFADSLYSQYLASPFHDNVVNMQIVHSGKYATGATTGNSVYVDAAKKIFLNQEFLIVSTNHVNWYKIKHQATNKFITIETAGENQPVYLDADGYNNNTDLQEFQFIAETQPGRYKIHSHYNIGGYDLLLEVDPNNLGAAVLRLGKNIPVGNSEHQKFDLDILYPNVDPSTAIPTLADRFEGRTCGFTMKHNGFQLTTSSTDAVYQTWPYADFNQKFKIEYSNETGWYKILHKASGKYLTVLMAANGADIALETDASYDDNYQKFKFIIQLNDSTYKIHTKFSNGIGTSKVALVLEAPVSNTDSIRCARNITSGSDANQQFIIRKYLPNPSQFTGGAAITGDGKNIGRSYHLTCQESLAMLEPYIVGTDTFVRVQQNPVYGVQSEWVIDRFDSSSYGNVRIRYAKTNQYLYIPSASQSAPGTADTRFILRHVRDTSEITDKRYGFFMSGITPFYLFVSYAGWDGNPTHYPTCLMINDDGYLTINDGHVNTATMKNCYFALNLVIPYSADNTWAISRNDNGHFISDRGIYNGMPVLQHIPTANESVKWHFVPTSDGHFWIRNDLSDWYIFNNGNTSESNIYSTPDSTKPGAKWDLVRDGNFFRIQNVLSTKQIGVSGYYEPAGGPLYQSSTNMSTAEKWVIVRSDMFDKSESDLILQFSTLRSPYNPSLNNALENGDYRNKMIQNVGMPFEPIYVQTTLGSLGNISIAAEGIALTPTAPSFYSVVRSAIQWKYGWNNAQADSAFKNYKLDSLGQRIEMLFALREYITNKLALADSSTWTFNEKELIHWVQRQVRAHTIDYGNRLLKSWTDWSASSTGTGGELLFSALISNPIIGNYQYPQPYEIDSLQGLSFLEYYEIAKLRRYRNSFLPSETSLVASVPAGFAAAICVESNNIWRWASLFFRIKYGPKPGIDPPVEVLNEEITEVAEILPERTAADFLGDAISTVCGAGSGAIVGIGIMAVQLLVQEAIETAKYENFNNRINNEVDSLRNNDANISKVMRIKNYVDQVNLIHDIDYVLGKGQRFDSLSLHPYVFTGSGNWSNPANWYQNKMPPFTLNNDDEVIINHAPGSNCIIDVPIKVNSPAKISVKGNQSILLKSKLTVSQVSD